MASPSPAEQPARGRSLRVRVILTAVAVLAVSLGLVGLALDSAYRASLVVSEQESMEGLVYQVLAALDVDQRGNLLVEGDLTDPRLLQPGSGTYVHVHGENDHWSSPSSLGADLLELPIAAPGERRFSQPWSGSDWFIFQYGIAWELESGSVFPYTVTVFSDPAALEAEASAFRGGLWRSLGAAGFILVLAQLFFVGIVMRPLRAVAKDVERVESGESDRLEGRYPRELEPLSRNVNRLLASEQANRERYRHALDSLAHSLKTPLAVIRAWVDEVPPDTARPIETAVNDMHGLVTTRLQRAAGSTRRTMARPIAIKPAVERVLASVRKVHSQKLIETDVIIPEDARFRGEERDLLELLGNLIDNAFRYGKSSVRVTASGDPDSWIQVEDDGPGIPEQRREEVLQRGVRGDEREEGHGLGLAIVAELVDAYDGGIEVGESELGGLRIRATF